MLEKMEMIAHIGGEKERASIEWDVLKKTGIQNKEERRQEDEERMRNKQENKKAVSTRELRNTKNATKNENQNPKGEDQRE